MDRLLATLTSAQLTEWMAFAELEPFGPLAEADRAGTVAAAVVNSAFGRSRGARVFKPEDFFPVLRVSRRQSVQEMKRAAQGLTQQMGGTVADTAGAAADPRVAKVREVKAKMRAMKPESRPAPAKASVKASVKGGTKASVKGGTGKK